MSIKSKIPIEISKIYKYEENTYFGPKTDTLFLLKIVDPGKKWLLTFECDQNDLQKFRDEINLLLDDIALAKELDISKELAEKLIKGYVSDKLCKKCTHQRSDYCVQCIDINSPLERQLYIALKENDIEFQMQYGVDYSGGNISMEGRHFNNPRKNFSQVLTIVDFYIEKGNNRLCVYTDGHSYHERTESQAQHDRNIDRKLQEFGFKVLRYTGKEVNENMQKIVSDIKDWIK